MSPRSSAVSLTDDDTIELPSDPDPVLDQDLGFGPSLVQDAFPADPEPAPAPKSERGPLDTWRTWRTGSWMIRRIPTSTWSLPRPSSLQARWAEWARSWS